MFVDQLYSCQILATFFIHKQLQLARGVNIATEIIPDYLNVIK
jgi:hypothetical protein